MRILWLSLAFIIAYTLPWLVNPGTGLTFGAYDLAEWTTLHPQVRSASPALLTSLLLRLPMICAAVILAFSDTCQLESVWWIKVTVVFGLLLFSMPPLEFFVGESGDINYRQQFAMAAIGFLIAVPGLLSIVSSRIRTYVIMGAAFVGIGASVFGVERANQLMFDLVLPVQRGVGVLMMAAYFTLIVYLAVRKIQDKQAHPVS